MSRAFQFIKDVIRGWLAADAFTLAASLAYYAIFAIAPLLLLSIQLASLFFDRTEAVTGLTNELVDVIGPTGSDAIKQMLDAAGTSEPQGWTGWLGIAVLLFAATGFVGSLQDALDRIWNAPPRPAGVWAFIRTKLFSFSLILAAAFLLLVSLVLSTAMTALTGRVTGMLALSEQAVALVVAFVNFLLAAAIFAAIFKYVPRAAVTWRAALAGGLFTAVLFAAGRFARLVFRPRSRGVGLWSGDFARAPTRLGLLLLANSFPRRPILSLHAGRRECASAVAGDDGGKPET
jgi:membrane protein